MDYSVAQQLLASLEREGVHYVIFGAVALGVHGLPRFTEDLDLFIEPETGNIARLKRALATVFDDPEIEKIEASDLLGEYPAVQYIPPDGTFHIDLLTRLGDAFAFADLETARVVFGDVTVTVATPATLYRMKKDTVRLKDRADAEMLRRRFNLEP